MSYEVRITKVATGESRVYCREGEWDTGEAYLWEEGNYSCDCNLALFFARASGEREPTREEAPCGQTRFATALPDAEPAPSVS